MKNKKINKKINKKNGFTLIELIVVITIIAVLTVIGVVSYGGTSKKARDSRRMADLEKIRIALELYRQGTGNTYPVSTASLVPTYLQEIPVDPKDKSVYSYGKTATGVGYSLGATVEDSGSTTSNVSGMIYKIINP